MFKNTIAWASFSVDNLEKAKEFYGTTLGIPLEDVKPGIVTLKLKGGNVNIFFKKHHVPDSSSLPPHTFRNGKP